MSFKPNNNDSNFAWGVSTAAYQIEGAWNIEGKGKSIWDVFANTKGKTPNGVNANVACDFYNRFEDDLAIMHQLGIKHYRFSISWSRILPNGIGVINHQGIDFYNRLITACLKHEIEPWITLYHWDLPHELELKGGWTNRDVINWFGDYVQICILSFGDRVKNWMVLNEPMVFTGAGYFIGVHAPGKRGLNNFLSATHHAAMCQAEGGRVIRSLLNDSKIGTTFSCSLVHPYTRKQKDVAAANRVDALLNRLFVEPLAGLGYPVNDLPFLKRMESFVKDGDEQKLGFNMDFIGIQNYTREMVTSSWTTPLMWAKIVKANKRGVEITKMNWEVYPESIYEMLMKFSDYKSFKEIIVTENGAAFTDVLVDSKINDSKRINYLEQNIMQVNRARLNGANVTGYFVWTFIDNFEWAEGYHPRFGLVYVDFDTQERIVKDSGWWYKQHILATQHNLLHQHQ